MGATGVGVPGQRPLLAREATATGAHRRGQNVGSAMNLPPGFRFHPTDEELAIDYLGEKALNPEFTAAAMGDVDLNKFEPWELRGQVKMVGGTQQNPEMYMFNFRDRKYPTGSRTNRATARGYWKATGKDKEIYTRVANRRLLVGMKKTLVFYTGRAPKGGKTDWVMHEYRLEMAGGDPDRSYWAAVLNGETVKLQDEWVVCRIFLKPKSANRRPLSAGEQGVEADSDDVSDEPSANEPSADEPPPLVEPPYTDYGGTGVRVKHAAEDAVASRADIEPPVSLPIPAHIGNITASFNSNQHYGPGPFNFLNDTQNQLITILGSRTTGSGLYNNPIPNSFPSSSRLFNPHFSLPPLDPMNPPLPFGSNVDYGNLVYGVNPVKNVGDAFITAPLQQQITPPIRMIPTPQTPRQCKEEEEFPVLPSPVEMFSPGSTVMSGAGGRYASPGGSSLQQMTSGGGSSIYQDAGATDDNMFSPGVMMNVPNNWP